MANNSETVCHEGIIETIDRDKIQVRILSQSACASCQVKGACNITEMEEKLIDVIFDHTRDYYKGQQVSVVMSKSLGNKAVLFGYFLPFVLMVFTLILTLMLTSNEGLSGIISILILIPYFIIMYLKKDQFKKSFNFSLQD